MNDNTKKMIFEELRKGTVPEEGHQAFAVGIEPVLNELQRNMESVSTGDKKGNIKFLNMHSLLLGRKVLLLPSLLFRLTTLSFIIFKLSIIKSVRIFKRSLLSLWAYWLMHSIDGLVELKML